MQEDFRTILLNSCTRVSWGSRVRGAPVPAVSLHLIDGLPDYVMAGPSGLVNSRVQADSWATSYAEASSLSRSVVSALSGFKGDVGGTHFVGVFVDAIRDLEDDGTGAEELLYRVSVDFQVWSRPT